MEWHETSKADLQKNLASKNGAILHPPPISVEGLLCHGNLYPLIIPNAPLISEYIYI